MYICVCVRERLDNFPVFFLHGGGPEIAITAHPRFSASCGRFRVIFTPVISSVYKPM